MPLREDIIHESMKLFSLKGYINTGVNEIIQSVDSSKGGFYNHFASKEELFFVVLSEAQKIWRNRVLYGLNELDSPIEKVIQILDNYRSRYLKDEENFPGGCIFITFSVELDDQAPELMKEVNKGFEGLKNLLKKLLVEAKESGELKPHINVDRTTEMIFSGMIGSSVLFGVEKSTTMLDSSINSLIDYLNEIRLVKSIAD
jgi:TetR/AcrR family transcriptional regulator, transcriptional repressor for nem operon